MADEIEHVARPALPWRDDSLTECGKTTSGRPIISRGALVEKVKQQGQARAAMTTCMTCWQTASRWRNWAEAPSEVMKREVPQWYQGPKAERLDAELRAIAALIEAHRDEFDGYLAGLGEATDLTARRAERAQRRARGAAPGKGF